MQDHSIKPGEQLDFDVVFRNWFGVHSVHDIVVVLFGHASKEVEEEHKE